jgi:hypothetical protein
VREDSREAKARMLSKLPLVTRLRLSLSFSYTCRRNGTNSFIFINIVGSQSRSFIINNIVGSTFISRFFGVVFPRLLLCLEACSRSVRPAAVGITGRQLSGVVTGHFTSYAFSQPTQPTLELPFSWPSGGGMQPPLASIRWMPLNISRLQAYVNRYFISLPMLAV